MCIEIFRDIFEDDNLIINNDTSSDDVEDWDSLAQINLILEIEKEFSIKFNIDEVIHLDQVGNMIELVKVKRESNDR